MLALRLTALSLLAFGLIAQTQRAADVGHAIVGAGLDPSSCYRVRDLVITEEDVRFYLTDGYIIFGKPVNGAPVAALFTSEVEGGDAEVLLLPPNRAERRTLAGYTGSPNLDEHFRNAVFLFTEPQARGLAEQIRAKGEARNSPEQGALLREQWERVVDDLAGSFESRMVLDLLSGSLPDSAQVRPGQKGFFEASIQGRKLGNFEIGYDGRSWEQIHAGQFMSRNGRSYFDTWTSFTSRSHRSSETPPPEEEEILSYRIEATLDPSLVLHCVTRIRLRANADSRLVIAFDMSGQMRATEGKVDGVAAEVYQRESMRESAVTDTGNEVVLVIPPRPLDPGSEHEVEIHHEGKVVLDAGHQVYFVGSRGSWYPNRGAQFAMFDTTFRYPKNLDLVSAGQVVEERTEDDVRITRRVTNCLPRTTDPAACALGGCLPRTTDPAACALGGCLPRTTDPAACAFGGCLPRTTDPAAAACAAGGRIRTLGFNLGVYQQKVIERGGTQIEVSANREVEDALRYRAAESEQNESAGRGMSRRVPIPPVTVPTPSEVASPPDQLSAVADDIAASIDFYRARFGPPPVERIEVSPVPGRFGQGFAGMIYLSTLSYLPATVRPLSLMPEVQQLFFGAFLRAHEVAHQWWGNIVTAASYRHEWLMESLANYSALMFLESRGGPKTLDEMLNEYRRQLLTKGPDGQTAESEGPVVEGRRLENSNNPNAWSAVAYGKGAWIMHMLRRRMGDAAFVQMLAELRRRYEWKKIDTEEFRMLCAQFLPPHSNDPNLENFFDEWVYGTGIPTLKLTYSVKGKPGALRLTGTVEQSDVPDDFSVPVPVEIQTGRGKVTKLVETGAEPAQFSVPVTAATAKAVLDPTLTILRR